MWEALIQGRIAPYQLERAVERRCHVEARHRGQEGALDRVEEEEGALVPRAVHLDARHQSYASALLLDI